MSIFRIFLRTFLSFFLALILVVNLDMFVQTLTNVNALGLTVYDTFNFDYYYFGFNSVTSSLTGLGDKVHITDFLNACTDFYNKVTLVNAPQGLQTNGEFFHDVLVFLIILLNNSTYFVEVTLHGVNLLLRTLGLLVGFIEWLYLLISGVYNTPLPNTSFLMQCGTYLHSLSYLPQLA